MEISEYLLYLEKLLENGGPNYSDYMTLESASATLEDVSIADRANLFDVLRPLLNMDSMIGHTFLKPHGYAGDFELIYKIYTEWKSDDPDQYKWDELYHSTETVKAIKARQAYFVNQTSQKYSENKPLSVLNLGSGACIDLLAFFNKNPRSPVVFDCVEMDEKAIEFGSSVCDNYIDSISFNNQNVFLFKSAKKYDLIWSAGLFEYFSDKLFISLIRKYFKLLNTGGEFIIANFSENNSSKALLDLMCRWEIEHRSEEKLLELATDAGIPKGNIEIKLQKAGFNLFLHIIK